jgi:hydroxymethylbilane synthase
LAELEGGCLVPLSAWARTTPEGLALDAAVFDSDGRQCVSGALMGHLEDPEDLGVHLARLLLARGAGEVLQEFRRHMSAGKHTSD